MSSKHLLATLKGELPSAKKLKELLDGLAELEETVDTIDALRTGLSRDGAVDPCEGIGRQVRAAHANLVSAIAGYEKLRAVVTPPAAAATTKTP